MFKLKFAFLTCFFLQPFSRDSDADVEVVFCSDPRPTNVEWEWETSAGDFRYPTQKVQGDHGWQLIATVVSGLPAAGIPSTQVIVRLLLSSWVTLL